jgi:hypothetical protein
LKDGGLRIYLVFTRAIHPPTEAIEDLELLLLTAAAREELMNVCLHLKASKIAIAECLYRIAVKDKAALSASAEENTYATTISYPNFIARIPQI